MTKYVKTSTNQLRTNELVSGMDIALMQVNNISRVSRILWYPRQTIRAGLFFKRRCYDEKAHPFDWIQINSLYLLERGCWERQAWGEDLRDKHKYACIKQGRVSSGPAALLCLFCTPERQRTILAPGFESY